MPRESTYVLRIWQSRTLQGWQWSARLEHLADGQQHRFGNREALLAHLEALVLDEAHKTLPPQKEGGSTIRDEA